MSERKWRWTRRLFGGLLAAAALIFTGPSGVPVAAGTATPFPLPNPCEVRGYGAGVAVDGEVAVHTIEWPAPCAGSKWLLVTARYDLPTQRLAILAGEHGQYMRYGANNYDYTTYVSGFREARNHLFISPGGLPAGLADIQFARLESTPGKIWYSFRVASCDTYEHCLRIHD